MILQCAVLLLFLAVGEILVKLTGVPIPSSIIGMLFLGLSLKYGIIRLGWVERISKLLVDNLGFFFIPAGVGIMTRLGLLGREWLPIVGASVISTILVLLASGHVHQLCRHIKFPSRYGFFGK